jgi:hypothetical protein
VMTDRASISTVLTYCGLTAMKMMSLFLATCVPCGGLGFGFGLGFQGLNDEE